MVYIGGFKSLSVTISPKNEKHALDLIRKLHSKLSIFQHKEKIYSLCNLINIKELKDRKIKRSLIEKTVRVTKKYKKLTINNFKKRLEIELNNYNSLPKKTYWIIFPTNIRNSPPFSNRTRIYINNSIIYIRNFGQIHNQFDMSVIKKDPKFMNRYTKYIPPSCLYFIIKQKGRNQDEVLHLAYSIFELFISIINFLEARTHGAMIRFPQAGPPQYMSIFPPEYMFIFDDKKKYIIYAFTTEKHDKITITVNNNLFTSTINTIKDFNKKKDNELKELFINTIRLYNNALERTNNQQMFLTFWQIIEIITLLGYRTKSLNKSIKNRLKITGIKNYIDESVIDEVCSLRNELVHSGHADLDDEDIRFVKIFSEECISFLWNQIDLFENGELLDKYYRYYGTNHSELRKRKFVIEKII